MRLHKNGEHLEIQGIVRASRIEVRNPILALPAAAALTSLGTKDRNALAQSLADLKRECAARALPAWHQRRTQAATFWKAASVYCGHIARATRGCTSMASCSLQTALPSYSPGASAARIHRRGCLNPLLALPAAAAVGALDEAPRGVLAAVLADLATMCRDRAERDFRRHKAPMAAYWWECSVFARHVRRAVLQPAGFFA
ncbi:hypothetical protein [Ramlibacter sp. AN1133]|uniref:hypothetical protein n=1 Tax=Ramlibacter sp. AN1133 TaxID=3133429 RepID=UPI0030C3A429